MKQPKPNSPAITAAISMLFFALIAAPSGAQELKSAKIELAPRVEAGGVYKMERQVKTTMSGGKQEHRSTEDYTLTVTAHGTDGKDKLVRSKVDRVRIETNATADGERIVYDSLDKSEQDPSLAEMAEGMLSITSSAIYGEDEVFKSFLGIAGDLASQAAMKKLTDLGFPKKPVGRGDTWKHNFQVDMGAMGQVKYDLDYEFVKMVRHDSVMCALLKIGGKMGTAPGPKANEGFDLKSRSLRGVMYFDPKLGAVRKFEINSQLDLTAYGKKMPGSMSIRNVLKKFSK